MSLNRRSFFAASGNTMLAAGLAGLAACERRASRSATLYSGIEEEGTEGADPGTATWDAIRQNFPLNYDYVQMSGHLVTSHPFPVRQAIDHYRRELDRNPAIYLNEHGSELEDETRRQAALYLGGQEAQVALTGSTTEGLGLLYSGIQLAPRDEIITTNFDYYSTHFALRFRRDREGIGYRQIPIFAEGRSVSDDEIVGQMTKAIQPNTRVVALTWVHSITGLKFPVRRVADAVGQVNRERAPQDRILVCVDAVHGLGVEKETPEELGADFLIAGCHKWMFGPRGTGIIWGRKEVWSRVNEVIPTFSGTQTPGRRLTPGGFCAFEHRWALAGACRCHRASA